MSQYIYEIPLNVLHTMNTTKLESLIYKNFEYLSKFSNIIHTPEYINELLHSDKVHVYLYMNGKIASGYLITETTKIADGRHVLFINYIYIGKKYRGDGIGNQLLAVAEKYAIENNVDGIMLVCDTHKKSVVDWYLRHGYMLDAILRTYNRNDTFYKAI